MHTAQLCDTARPCIQNTQPYLLALALTPFLLCTATAWLRWACPQVARVVIHQKRLVFCT